MFENPRRGRQAINFTTNVPKILDLYATPNDPRPQMIPKIDLNTTRSDPRPQMIPQFFHMRPEMIPDELSEWDGMTFNSRRC